MWPSYRPIIEALCVCVCVRSLNLQIVLLTITVPSDSLKVVSAIAAMILIATAYATVYNSGVHRSSH